jgi:flagellin
MVINTNIEAQATTNNLNLSQSSLAKSLARLSSGSSIIVPSDDAAGLAVSSRLRSQIARLDSSLSNVINAVSFTQTQDGFMKTIDKAYRRMGELAILSQDTTKSDADRALYNQEFQQLKSYVQETTKQDFNGVSLFSGATLDVTVDAEGTTFSMVGINLGDPTYTSAINTGTDSWKLTQDAYMVSKDGYQAKQTVYKTSVDLWRDNDGNWATSDNGGIKVNSGSYVSESGAATADTGEATIAQNNFVAGATLNAGFKTDYINNKLIKTAHGMESGDAITFHSNVPGGLTATTTYYVNKTDTNNITLHATKADATGASDALNLTRADASTSNTGVSVIAATNVFTKTAHGYETGDKVVFNSGAPAAAANGTPYYVKKVDANTFTLHTTANAPGAGNIVNVAADTTDLTLESNMKTGGNVNDTTEVVTMSAHGLSSGTKGMITTTAGGATASTVVYVKKLDANTYELYTNSDLATGKINFSGAVSDGSFRLAIDESAARVALNDKSNELKKGMFLTTSPITTGEDLNAVLAKTGEVVNINKTTQDISTFATEQEADYDNTNLKSVLSSQIALSLVKLAITQVATDRARLGAVQSRLNFTNEQLTVTKENLSAAISRIADVDVAEEATSYARYQILVQSGVEMLKQANQLPQSALNLLR